MDHVRRGRGRKEWEPLDLWNREYLAHLRERRRRGRGECGGEKDYVQLNIVSWGCKEMV